MSARLKKFDKSHLLHGEFTEEQWDKESLDLDEEEEHHHEDSSVHLVARFSDKEVSRKRYRLVYNKKDASVRLEAPQGGSEPTSTAAVSPELSDALSEVINVSRSILDLKDNWDEEGSPGYDESTWDRATELVRNVVADYWKCYKVWPDSPKIQPGPEGSIDINWRLGRRELLINVPANEKSPVTYFGIRSPKETIKGKLDPSLSNEWILLWLLR